MIRTLLVTALLTAAAGCSKGGEEAEIIPRVPVGILTVTTDTLTDAVPVVGRLSPTPGGSALLTAPAPGVVSKVLVQVGAPVRPGATLIELSVPELTQNARGLAAAADAAEKDAKRQQELLVQGLTSQRQAEQRAAEAVAARAQASAAASLLARAHVRSPISGAVQRVMVHEGEQVDAAKELIEVINGTTLDLVASVPAKDLAHLRIGQTARVTMDGSSESRPGRLVAIAPAVDSLTNSAQVIVRIVNRDGALRAGTGATAMVETGAHKNALVIPDSALVVVGDSMTVFVVEGDTIAKARSVTVGVRRNGVAEILAGLRAGERIVVSGAFGLVDGMLVVPADSAAP
jgi:RND family efflux transporter MFP subunit